jgi:predicted unusual protein kinase regulating ubiquinone biosynthesis (AarF/ABC1/UbiB family)
VPVAVRALFDAALALVRQSSSGSVGLARLVGVFELDAVPERYRRRVARELDAAVETTGEPLPRSRIERELRSAWGRRPADVLDALEPEPLALTASAQVHRGVLDGAAVAVKLRRPGLEAAVRSDLGLLDALATPLAQVFGAADPGALLREARERVLDELDLEHAGATQRRFARAARRLDGVTVPAVHGELSAPGVLVTELLQGPTLADGSVPADAGAVARALVAFHCGAPRALALVPADPRPDHVVLLRDGGIGLLGTGAARSVDRARLDAALDALAALRDQDAGAFATAVGRMQLLPADAVADAYALVDELAGDLLRGPVRVQAALLAERTERALAALPRALPLADRVTPDRADLWPLRMLGQLAALMGRLDVEEDWAALALDAGRAGWDDR